MFFSKSKVLTYKNCGRLYRYQYIEQLKQPERDENHPLTIGIDIHALFEKFLNDYTTENIQEMTSKDIQRSIMEYDNANRYRSHIFNFSNFIKGVVDDGYKIIGNELYVSHPLLGLHGYIDLVLEKDNKLVVIDYKTGKTNPLTKYRLELVYYGFLANYLLQKEVDMVGIFFSKGDHYRFAKMVNEYNVDDELLNELGINPKSQYLTQEDIDMAFLYFLQTKQQIMNEEFPYKRSWLCAYCDFVNECEKEGFDSYGIYG